MKVLALSKYGPLAASTRYRFLQYVPYLDAEGLHVEASALLGDDYLGARYRTGTPALGPALRGALRRGKKLLHARSFDVGWWAYELFPYAPAWVERSLWPPDIPFVLDVDDATFHIYDQSPNRWIRRALGPKISSIARRAAAVTAGSEYLMEYFERAGGRVHHIPTVVDTERYLPRDRPRAKKDFVVGWMGTPATTRFVAEASAALSRVERELGARIRLVGASDDALPAVNREVQPWSIETEVTQIQGFDVGIMPLPDTPFTRGKCAFKLIQYMACGIPVVASPVGQNRPIVERSGAGYLAANEQEWVEALVSLYRDPADRAHRGALGRAFVETHYSVAVVAPRIARILGGAGRTR